MIGQTISHYKILEKLGEGGMGVVYKAEDIKLKRSVAIKFLPERLSMNHLEREHLRLEAQAASTLNHPNICTIHEIEDIGEEAFIVMEFIDGRSLRSMIDQGRIPIADIIKIALNVGDGLHAAHSKGIVHRDMKPENIIVTNDGIAKIADFGLARAMDMKEESESTSVAGTITYMSPEQLRGEQIDHLTDIWSFGVVLYEMATGIQPFHGEYSQATAYGILNQKHEPASAVRPDIPRSLEKIIDRCLEKVSMLRFQRIASLLEELRKVDLDTATPRATTTKSIAVLPFEDISPDQDNKYFSDGLTEEIISSLSRLRNVKIISRTSMMAFIRAGKTIKQIGAELGVQFVLEGSVRKHGSDLRITAQLVDANQDRSLWSEKYGGTLDQIFDIQENVAQRIVKALKVRLTPDEKRALKRRATKNTEAYQLYLKGRFFWNKRSKEGLLKAVEYFEGAIKLDAEYAPA